MINSYRDLAPEVLYLSDEAFDRFVAALEKPPAPSAKLRKLLKTPAPWENAA